jgi:ferredoxin-NADP reductase
MAPDFMEREVFCCGPTPYMNAVKRMLEAVGFDMSRYHEESFGATPPEARADAVEQAGNKSISAHNHVHQDRRPELY